MASKMESVAVSGDARIRRVVEDVEALVLHGPHVEVRHGDDVEDVEVVFASEAFFVPRHRPLQRVHGPLRARFLAVLDVDVQPDLAARHRFETRRYVTEVSADKGEQVAGLGERVVPLGKMPVSRKVAALARIAVAEKHGCLVAIRLDAHRVCGEHVGPVEEVGDAPEALRLALRTVDAARPVDALQRLVVFRVARRFDFQLEGLQWRLMQGERGRRHTIRGGRNLDAVDAHVPQRHLLAIENQCAVPRRFGVRPYLQARNDPGGMRGERHVEVHMVDKV